MKFKLFIKILLFVCGLNFQAAFAYDVEQTGMTLGGKKNFSENINEIKIIGDYFIGISYARELYVGKLVNSNVNSLNVNLKKIPLLQSGDELYVDLYNVSCRKTNAVDNKDDEISCIVAANSEKKHGLYNINIVNGKVDEISTKQYFYPKIISSSQFYAAEINLNEDKEKRNDTRRFGVSLFDLSGNRMKFGDEIHSDEIIKYINVGARIPVPVAISSGFVRLLFSNTAPVPYVTLTSLSEGNRWVDSGLGFYSNAPWWDEANSKELSINHWNFKRGSNDGPALSYDENFKVSVDDNLIFDDKIKALGLKSDLYGNIFTVFGSKNGQSVGLICKSSNSNNDYEIKEISNNSFGYMYKIHTDPEMTNLVFSIESPNSPRDFYYVNFDNIKYDDKNLTKTYCSASKPVTKKITFNYEAPTNKKEYYNYKISTGAKLFLNDNPKKLKHLILNVYGASGLPSMSNFFPNQIPNGDKVSIGWAVVRGDGDYGKSFAMSARAPNRNLSYEDLNMLVAELLKQNPHLKGRITLRGISAGAWVASMAALEKPEFYSGVIAISGGYNNSAIFSDNKDMFHSSTDNLSDYISKNISEGCGGISFRIIHSRDDKSAPFSQAESFYKSLVGKLCRAEFEVFKDGGHYIGTSRLIGSGYNIDRVRRDKAVSDPVYRQ